MRSFLLAAIAAVFQIKVVHAGDECADKEPECANWAGQTPSECSANPPYMTANCAKSCNKCPDCATCPGACLHPPEAPICLQYEYNRPSSVGGPQNAAQCTAFEGTACAGEPILCNCNNKAPPTPEFTTDDASAALGIIAIIIVVVITVVIIVLCCRASVPVVPTTDPRSGSMIHDEELALSLPETAQEDNAPGGKHLSDSVSEMVHKNEKSPMGRMLNKPWSVPAAVSKEDGERVRAHMKQLMAKYKVGDGKYYPQVCITYATGRRATIDADGCGPGMYYALQVALALDKRKVGCFSGLMVDGGENWKIFMDKLGGDFSKTKVLIVIVTPALYKSFPCMNEICKALDKKRVIKPLVFEDYKYAKFEAKNIGLTAESPDADMLNLQTVQDVFDKQNKEPAPPETVLTMPAKLDEVLDKVALL